MDPNSTRLFIHCYAGDAVMIIDAMDCIQMHRLPITVMSPEDHPAAIHYEGIDNVHAGKQAYIGQDSLDRQILHMKAMLNYPEEWFLCYDADSFFLDPEIPAYLYQDKNVLWSCQLGDGIADHQPFFEEGWPHIALQPPYFMHRSVCEKLIAVADDPRCKASPMMPFIDFFMLQLVMVANVPWKRFLGCINSGVEVSTRRRHITVPELVRESPAFNRAVDLVNEGGVVIHSMKSHHGLRYLIEVRRQYKVRNPRAKLPDWPYPTVT